MRIVLISPNTLTEPYPVYPLGLDYVAGSVAADHDVRIVDLNVASQLELETLLQEFRPQIIGLSCRNIDNTEVGAPRYFIDEYRKLVGWLKSKIDAVIVCGGSGFTIMPVPILQAVGADWGIVGEGERFALLVRAIEQGEDPGLIPGVISPPGSGEFGPPEPWQGKRVLDAKGEAAHRRFYLDKGGMLNLQSKRGCSFNCVYCPYPAIEGRKHRLIEPETVAETALALEAAGAKYIFITDSAFNSDIAHSLAVAESFKAKGLSIPWGGFFAPVKLPPGYFTVMAEAGLKHVEFGSESLAESMLRSYRKPFTVDDIFRAHRQALDAGLHAAHYFLLGGPGESPTTVNQTLDGLEKLTRTVFFFFFGIRIYPQTGLYDIALKEEQITAATNLLEPVFYESDTIGPEEIKALVTARVGGRKNCIIGSGGAESAALVARMHAKGYAGPLWEYLIR